MSNGHCPFKTIRQTQVLQVMRHTDVDIERGDKYRIYGHMK